jgi:hypothetical protein
MITTSEYITPAKARQYLEAVDPAHQRPLSQKYVEELARAMRCHQWITNHQGVAFDEKGRLIDGQHRLTAIVESGQTVLMNVTRGLAEKTENGATFYTIDGIDRGRARTVGQQLELRRGINDGGRYAAACAAIIHYCATQAVRITTPLTVRVLDTYGTHIKAMLSCRSNVPGLRSAHLTGALAFGRAVFRDEMDAFALAVVTGEQIKRGQPAYALRNYLLTQSYVSPGGGSREQRIFTAALVAARHHVLGNPLSIIKPSDSGPAFFAEKQKGNVRKIREYCGLEA